MRVFIASPLAGHMTDNILYARLCLTNSLIRGEAPFAPHLLYPQVLDDCDEHERKLGINAGLEWLRRCELLAVYVDRGVSAGMRTEIAEAERLRIPTERRQIL